MAPMDNEISDAFCGSVVTPWPLQSWSLSGAPVASAARARAAGGARGQ